MRPADKGRALQRAGHKPRGVKPSTAQRGQQGRTGRPNSMAGTGKYGNPEFGDFKNFRNCAKGKIKDCLER